MKGLAVFYKPKDWSSYDLIRFLKKELREKIIGHGGTLDPLAEGILIVGIKKEGTKQLENILKNQEKEYIASILLGVESDTYDITGKLNYSDIKEFPSINDIREILDNFSGRFLQKPPKFSAVKISGKPAYKLARKREEFTIQPKEVEVKEIEIMDYKKQLGELKLKLVVHSGCYVRSLANDIGKELETGGVLKELIRTRIGNFNLNEAITIEDFKKQNLEIYFHARGKVQGVCFRDFTKLQARELDIKGKAFNLPDGSIEIIGQGKEKNLQIFLKKILEGPYLAEVENPFYYFRKPQEQYSDFSRN